MIWPASGGLLYLFLLICLFIAVIVAAGYMYQMLGSRRDRKQFTGQGRMVSIGPRHQLYVLEKGVGGPTVVFESGIAATNLNWHHIQEVISETTHTVSYDRGGLGWSSPSMTARTPGNIACELHTMLEEAGIKPPFVLVGHSFGGLVMRRYAVLFPEQILGVVLVDPMRPEEWPPLNPAKLAEVNRGKRLSGYAIPIARCGLTRLAVTSLFCRSGQVSDFIAGAAGNGGRHVLGRIKGEVGKMPPEVWPMVAAHWSRPGYYAGMNDHVSSVPDTVREMQDSEPIRGIPVTLLTPGKSVPLCEAGVRLIGDNVRQTIATESAHWIHLDQPEVVIDAIRGMVMSYAVEEVAAAV
jgi:pimeloyl-ACP methyl ester carboxylesterase